MGKNGIVDRKRLTLMVGTVSVVVNLLLFALKYYAGVVSASVALLADAWHTLSDSLTSVVMIWGIHLASKKPDRKHPYGHGRWSTKRSRWAGWRSISPAPTSTAAA